MQPEHTPSVATVATPRGLILSILGPLPETLFAHLALTRCERRRSSLPAMNRVALITAAAISSLAAAMPAAAGTAIPGWVPALNHVVLRGFGGARPIQTHYISYPHKL